MTDRKFYGFISLTSLFALGALFYIANKKIDALIDEELSSSSPELEEISPALQRKPLDRRWLLPRSRSRKKHSPEDNCSYCNGDGRCPDCFGHPCTACFGRGIELRDRNLVSHLSEIWNGE